MSTRPFLLRSLSAFFLVLLMAEILTYPPVVQYVMMLPSTRKAAIPGKRQGEWIIYPPQWLQVAYAPVMWGLKNCPPFENGMHRYFRIWALEPTWFGQLAPREDW